MKIYLAPHNSKVVLLEGGETPPDCQGLEAGMELEVKTLDGMYVICYTKHGERVYVKAWTEVEVLDKG